jgi:hypothetical protein
MADELIFYNDEYYDRQLPKPPPKPRKRPTTDQPGDWDARVREWEASKARQPKFKHILTVRKRNRREAA